ncbi:MAG TPA: AI-2E family transporter [Thermodesulfovibrionales bacterium]|nr:AI-2E family transporter [Thermodesulfovibrionales bacterium]
MPANRFYLFMLLSILTVLGYLSYQIFLPFLTPITWAIVFCVVFYPVYAFSLRFIRLKAMASLLTLMLILVVIIGPFSYISYTLMSEVTDFVGRAEITTKKLAELLAHEHITKIMEKIQPYTGIEGPSEEIIIENTKKLGKKVVEGLSFGFTNAVSVAGNFVVMAFTIFFLFKDGPGFLEKIRDYLPFSENHRNRLVSQIRDMIVSTIYGGVIVAIVQGILGGLAFAVLGIGSPVFWGCSMALMSFIPVLGTSVIWFPASLILLFHGAFAKGIALILIGVLVISMVDNILKPLIIGGRTKMPTIIIFFTVLGGIKVFGLLGLIMGPLVFALFLSVFQIFKAIEGGIDA